MTAFDEMDYATHWRTLAIGGAIVGLLGLVAIAFPFVSGISIAYALGLLLVAGGLVHGVHTVTDGGWRGRLWQAALAAVSLLAGLFVLADPVLGLVSLTVVVIAYLLVDGVAELGMSARMGSVPGRGVIAGSGLLSLVLAGILFLGFPADAAWVVGVVVGVSLLATGVSMVVVAYEGRSIAARAPAGEPRGA